MLMYINAEDEKTLPYPSNVPNSLSGITLLCVLHPNSCHITVRTARIASQHVKRAHAASPLPVSS